MNVPAELKGLRTMFTSFHHFLPEEARAVLQNAVDAGEGIGIFEITAARCFGYRDGISLGSYADHLHAVDPSLPLVTVALDVSSSGHSFRPAI